MPIYNIINCRRDQSNCNVQVVFEDSWRSDNKLSKITNGVKYFCIGNTTIYNAVMFANHKWDHYVTLYVYNIGTSNRINYPKLSFDGTKFIFS